MLVLSRSLNQSIVIDEAVEVYVVGISAESVDLVILGLPDVRVRRCTVNLQETVSICGEVTLTLVRIHDDKARLGIYAPRETTIHRSEFAR